MIRVYIDCVYTKFATETSGFTTITNMKPTVFTALVCLHISRLHNHFDISTTHSACAQNVIRILIILDDNAYLMVWLTVGMAAISS